MLTTLPLPTPAAPFFRGPDPSTVADAARDAVKTYAKGDATVHALAGVSVDFERGRFTAILGPSGSLCRSRVQEGATAQCRPAQAVT